MKTGRAALVMKAVKGRKLDLAANISGGAALAAVGFSLYGAASAPSEVSQGESAKLLFIHVPAVVAAYLALGTAFLSALWHLIRRSAAADRLSASAVDVGVVFTALTLLSGMIWGRAVWGVWWDWGDARMMSTAVMFFFYLGYQALRRAAPEGEARSVRCAVLAVVGFLQVPVVHYSVLWFRTLHQGPTILQPDGLRTDGFRSTMDDAFALPLTFGILAFAAGMTSLMAGRLILMRLYEARGELWGLGAPVGGRVTAPFMGDRDE